MRFLAWEVSADYYIYIQWLYLKRGLLLGEQNQDIKCSDVILGSQRFPCYSLMDIARDCGGYDGLFCVGCLVASPYMCSEFAPYGLTISQLSRQLLRLRWQPHLYLWQWPISCRKLPHFTDQATHQIRRDCLIRKQCCKHHTAYWWCVFEICRHPLKRINASVGKYNQGPSQIIRTQYI